MTIATKRTLGGFSVIAQMLRYTAVLAVGIYGPMLPFVAEVAADPPGIEEGPALDDFLTEVDVLADELDVPFDDETGTVVNTQIVAASTSAIVLVVNDAEENQIGAGAFTAWGFEDGKAVTAIEYDSGSLENTYDLVAYVENGKVVVEGSVTVVDTVLETTHTYTGKAWIEEGEFVTTPQTDVEFAESLAAIGGYTGEDPEFLGWVAVIAVVIILGVLGLGICEALFEGCGPLGDWLTRVGQWLQNIMI